MRPHKGRLRLAVSALDRICAMERLDLLKQLSFGTQVAEDETNDLAKYFVETHQWTRIARGEIDIIRGDKGAGKSAIYSLLIERKAEFFDNGILIVGAENPRGATVFKDLTADPPASETEFIILWKLYILTIASQELREYGVRTAEAERVFKALEDAALLERESTLSGVLRRVQYYAKHLFTAESVAGGVTIDQNTGMITGLSGRIVLREPINDLRQHGIVSIDSLFASLDKALGEYNYKIWILLDRLDVAFIENHALEANALRALIRAYGDFRSLHNIGIKIFLREDIWKRIMAPGYREASHLVRYDNITWTQPALLNLIMRRLLNNKILNEEFGIDSVSVLQDARQQERLFEVLFPKQVEQGPQKATTFKWMVTRCADSTKKTAPRELIHLLNCIRDQEIRRLEQGGRLAPDAQLFDRSVFKAALPTVSDARLNQYLYAEYPNYRDYLEKLDGQKTEQTSDSLADIWGTDKMAAIAKADELVELGFFEKRGTRDDPTFWVPFLYRDALHLIQGRAETDDEC
jgi:hypothetical protein